MQTLKRLFAFLIPYWKTLLLSAVLILILTILGLLPPLFQRQIVDEVIGTGDLSKLGMLIGGLVLVYALQQLINAADMYIRHALGERFILDLRVHIYAYLQRLSLSFFERTSTGELMSRVTNDVNALESFVTHGSALTVIDLLRLVGGAAILLVLDARWPCSCSCPCPSWPYRFAGTTPASVPSTAACAPAWATSMPGSRTACQESASSRPLPRRSASWRALPARASTTTRLASRACATGPPFSRPCALCPSWVPSSCWAPGP